MSVANRVGGNWVQTEWEAIRNTNLGYHGEIRPAFRNPLLELRVRTLLAIALCRNFRKLKTCGKASTCDSLGGLVHIIYVTWY